MVRDNVGAANEVYVPFIYSLFFFIIIANLNGNIPYGFTVTTSIVVSIGLSVIIFLGVTILGLQKHGLHFFSYFIPSGTPLALVPLLVLIELISYMARAVSLGVRLFANMVAGHTLLKILSTFLYNYLQQLHRILRYTNSFRNFRCTYRIRISSFSDSSLRILYSYLFIPKRCYRTTLIYLVYLNPLFCTLFFLFILLFVFS